MNNILHDIEANLRASLDSIWDTKPWKGSYFTDAVCRGLANTQLNVSKACKLPEAAVRCFCRGDGGEYLLDFVMTTYPPSFHYGDMEAKPRAPFEILLAAESEQGVEKDKRRNFTEVLNDLCRLLDTKARIKVFVYRCHENGKPPITKHLIEAFESLLQNHRGSHADEQWLFFGVPWQSTLTAITHVLGDSATRPPQLVRPAWAQ